MKLILKYLKKYPALIVLNVIGILSFAGVQLGIPYITGKMIDHGINTRDIPYLKEQAIIMLVVSVVGGLGTILLNYASARTSTYMIRDIRTDVFAKIQDFSHAEYNKFGVSSMITRTTNDGFQLMLFSNILFRTALMTPIMMGLSVFLTIRTSMTLTLINLLCVPFVILAVYLIAKISNPLSVRQQKGLDKLNRVLRENLTGVRVIRAFRKNDYEADRFAQTNGEYVDSSKKLFKLMGATQPIFFLMLHIVMMGVYWAASLMINKNTLAIGNFIAFLDYQFHALYSLMLFANVFVMYPRAQVSASRIQEILDETPSILSPKNGVTETNGDKTLEFDHVSFQYPDGELPILSDVSFKAHKGETVAFIGSTGSGKSTLINLIPRFYDVTSGSIKVDGVDVRDYDLKSLRKKIGFIPQKSFLFKGTIASNLYFGKGDATKEDLVKAAKTAQASDFIEQKPLKYQEYISESGKNVSGGQKQRLSIARAIIRSPELYIFDDSFSALDFKTDATLRNALSKETNDAIVLIVAQRISSIMNADQIIVLNEGNVVGMGTHKELLKSCKVYYEIADSQLTKEELEQ